MKLLAIFLVAALSASNPIILSVHPQVAIVKSDIDIQVRIFPLKDNRLLTIKMVGGDIDNASEKQLDGENAPILWKSYYKDVLSGHYEVSAWITQSNGKIIKAPNVVVEIRGNATGQ